MDFDEVYIAGRHQWDRLRQRTEDENIYDLIKNGKVVLMKGRQKFFKHNNHIIPVIKSDSGINVIRTILNKDMYIYEYEMSNDML